jgi:hypothetical protein
MPSQAAILARGLVGAVVGGLLGYILFRVLISQRMYGLMLPGVGLGIGAALMARQRSHTLGILCGIAAVVVGLVAEWSVFPFLPDDSLFNFMTHLHQLSSMTWLFVGFGGACAWWFGQGR